MASNLPALVPGPATDYGLWSRVTRYARCADSGLDPDEWFPVSTELARARQEAAAAIAVCTSCLVRDQCLALSLRHWDIGQHGIWGGLVAADRARLRLRLLAALGGTPQDCHAPRTAQVIRPADGLDMHVVTCTPIATGVPPAGGNSTREGEQR